MTPKQAKANDLFVYALPRINDRAMESIDDILNKAVGWAGGYFSGLGHEYAATNGLYAWFVDQDLAAAKQWFYLAAKLIAVSTTKPVGYSNLWTCHDFMYPLLSDCSEIIELYSTLETPELIKHRDNPKEGWIKPNIVQVTLKGDYGKLAELIDLLEKKGLKRSKKFNECYIQFFRGLINGNLNEMEHALIYLGKQKSVDPTTEDFLAFHAVVLCKIAWLKGYPVQVDSPLVPMAFMPVNPLPFYDDVYEFLKPGWVAPPPPPEYAAK